MRNCLLAAAALLISSAPACDADAQSHRNALVDLHAAKAAVFGLYAPANPRGRGGRGRGGAATDPSRPTPPPPAQKTPAELAKEAVAYTASDYLFDGSMEGNFDAGYASFSEYMKGMAAALPAADRLKFPFMVKTHEIAENVPLAQERIARQLNLGVAGIVFVGVESADEVKAGLAAMRFTSKGGVRPDDVGGAPAYWGMSDADYREKADLWPLNPKGELVNWTIVESKEGLAHVREIAAVKGIGVLFPGAGTLGGVFRKVDAAGQPVLDANGRPQRDDVAWEAAIQQVLAACKEFNVPCGFPANDPETMAMRYQQGFRVFVIGWGENGFRTVEAGKKLAGR
ncbi:MAG TPA: hypothetical protein VG916_07590 [Gemmatimonadaceae bacterium]|nr:hypothetical protein [Gemmatimonadaceae bacterium]